MLAIFYFQVPIFPHRLWCPTGAQTFFLPLKSPQHCGSTWKILNKYLLNCQQMSKIKPQLTSHPLDHVSVCPFVLICHGSSFCSSTHLFIHPSSIHPVIFQPLLMSHPYVLFHHWSPVGPAHHGPKWAGGLAGDFDGVRESGCVQRQAGELLNSLRAGEAVID